jgi:hypothetical protein
MPSTLVMSHTHLALIKCACSRPLQLCPICQIAWTHTTQPCHAPRAQEQCTSHQGHDHAGHHGHPNVKPASGPSLFLCPCHIASPHRPVLARHGSWPVDDSQHLEHDVVTTTRHASARTGLATDTPVHHRAPSTPPTLRPLLVPAASPRRQRAR